MRPHSLAVTLGLITCIHASVPGDSVLRAAAPAQAQTGGARSETTAFRVLRSVSGSKGSTQGGRFMIGDPRTVFHVPEDRQVIVYFEWQGPPGPHRFQGSWKSPEGKVVLISDFQYVARESRFSGYWTLALPENVMTGLWALEAQIDGQPAGDHTFEITAGPGAAPPPAPMPTLAEVYRRAAAASVFIAKLDANGEPVSRGSGFFIAPGVVLTAFQVIDGASSLRLEFPDGSRATTNEALVWNRWQDWALLRVEGPGVPPLERAQPGSWKVGDTCYVMRSAPEGGRTIETVGITGTLDSREAGERLNISWFGQGTLVGSPLLDVYGRVIGVLGGSLVPGLDSFKRLGRSPSYTTALPANLDQLLVVPISLVAEPKSQTVTLAELAAQGQFITPLPRSTPAYLGYLCKDYSYVGRVAITPVDTTSEFSHRDTTLAVVVTWAPPEKLKTTELLRVYDLNNHVVGESPARKIQFNPHITAYSAWKVSIGSLQPGLYRVDVFLGDEPQWRAFFRIAD